MNLRLSHIAKIIFALCLVAGLLAITAEAAQAYYGLGCTPDGRPYFALSIAKPGELFIVYANGQNVGSFTGDANGNGSLAFGQPGVDYAVEIGVEGRFSPAGTINCPPPAGGGQGDTGQTAPQLTCIEVKPASASQSRDFTRLVTQRGASIQGPAAIHTIALQQTTCEVNPPLVNMDVGQQQLFTATGRDQNGNPYTLSNPTWTTSGGGTLSPNGSSATYTATQAGDFTITVGEGGTTIRGTATIHSTTPSQLTSIEMNPTSVNMDVGQQRLFTATGRDQNGNPYTLSNPTWTTSGGGTLSPNGSSATYTATQAGDFTITAGEGGTTIQGTASIHSTTPSQLTSIEMNPTSVNMDVGQQRLFTATGRDQNGNPYTLSNPTWTTSGGGTLSPNGSSATYTATQAGDFTISAGEAGTTIQGIATIQVKPTGTSALPWIIGGVLALGIAAGAGYWLWGRPKG